MKRSNGEKIFGVINILILLSLSFLCLFPFLNIFARSLSTEAEILSGRVTFFPRGFTLLAYQSVIKTPSMTNALTFTVWLTLVGTVCNLLITICAAYPLSKKDFPGVKVIWLLILFTMFFSGGLMPTYLLVRGLGLGDKIWALILPGVLSTYNLIIMKTFFMGVPHELEESAMLDGATDIGVLFRIILPLSLPIMATLGLFYAVGHWNQFFQALLYIDSAEKYTLQLRLRQILFEDDANDMAEQLANPIVRTEALKSASVMFATIPILVVYPWLQKYFVKGVLIGAVKS